MDQKDKAGNSFSGGGLFLPEAENHVTLRMHTIQADILPCISSMDTFLYRWLATDSSITDSVLQLAVNRNLGAKPRSR